MLTGWNNDIGKVIIMENWQTGGIADLAEGAL